MKKLLIALLALASLTFEASAFRFFGRNKACGACPVQCENPCPPQCPKQVDCAPRTVKTCPPKVRCCRRPVRCCTRPRTVCPPVAPVQCPQPVVKCKTLCPKPDCCYPYYQGRHCSRAVCATTCPAPEVVYSDNANNDYTNGYRGGRLTSTPEGLPVEGEIIGQTQYQVVNDGQSQYYQASNNVEEDEMLEDDYSDDLVPAAVSKDGYSNVSFDNELLDDELNDNILE